MRGPRPAPKRTDVEPADIREILADTFILNAEDARNFQFRLAGSRVCSLYCRELKGKDFLSFWSGADLTALQTLLDAIRAKGAAAVIGWEGHNVRRQSVMFETLLLPLETENGCYHRIMGSTAAAEAPYWLGIHPILEQSIVSLRMIWPNDAPVFDRVAPQEQDKFAPPPIQVDPRSGLLARRRGHLLIYDGGKRTESTDLTL